MIKTSHNFTRPRSSWLSSWPQWSGYATALWSLFYAALGLYWTLGGAGFPFGRNHDPNPEYSVLGTVQVEVAAPIIAALGLIGGVVAILMQRMRGRTNFLCVGFLGFAWSMVLVLVLVIPDFRTLAGLAYAFLLKFSILNWSTVHQFLCIVGGVLWGMTAVSYQRRVHRICVNCGRSGKETTGWTTPAAAARWGKWVTLAAILIPLVYTTTRIAWAFDIPLGVSSEFLHSMNREFPGIWIFGASLGLLEIGGGILTSGLIQPWGETFPRWTLFLSGKQVPLALAIIPASLVSVLVIEAGLMIWRAFVFGAFGGFSFQSIGTFGPSLLWPLWGLALGAATLAYYYRRRGHCKYCGRF